MRHREENYIVYVTRRPLAPFPPFDQLVLNGFHGAFVPPVQPVQPVTSTIVDTVTLEVE